MTPLEWIGDALWTSIPVVGVGLFVWLLFRSIIRADATERKVYAEIEAEERAKLAESASEPSEASQK
jgi:cytochrome c-type biogenesis protein CcmH/NrfF